MSHQVAPDKIAIPFLPRALRPLARTASALFRKSPPPQDPAPLHRRSGRLSTEKLSNQLSLTVLTGHPDQKALQPHLQQAVEDWRNHDWRRLGMHLFSFDRAHKALPSGERIAPALGRALFRHLAGPAACAAMDRGQSLGISDLPDDLFSPLLRILPQMQIDPTLHFLAAQFHLEMGWARHGDDYADYALDESLNSAEARFRAAGAILDRIAPQAPHSGYFSEIEYRIRAAAGTTEENLTRAAFRWSICDAGSLVPFATHGLHLLPRWYGGETSLEDYASASWMRMSQTLGAAPYAAAYLSALENDLEAGLQMDQATFRTGLIDMMQRSDDPDLTCNAILRVLWEASSDDYIEASRETRALRELRQHLRALFCDLTRVALGPVMPDVWGGRWTEAKILHAVAEAFAKEIAAGRHIAIGLEGAQISD
ncbi:MAG: hypothetical protein VXY45_13560 [Pseudomonadota bacterium]|nr:hypothetical protein [Pseudomonadota bacterium]